MYCIYLNLVEINPKHNSHKQKLNSKFPFLELNNECRSMLTATKDCLESVKSGAVVSSHCSKVQSRIRSLMTAAVAAERLNSGSTSVDDELADMDRAIEEAASQIEVRIFISYGECFLDLNKLCGLFLLDAVRNLSLCLISLIHNHSSHIPQIYPDSEQA